MQEMSFKITKLKVNNHHTQLIHIFICIFSRKYIYKSGKFILLCRSARKFISYVACNYVYLQHLYFYFEGNRRLIHHLLQNILWIEKHQGQIHFVCNFFLFTKQKKHRCLVVCMSAPWISTWLPGSDFRRHGRYNYH